MKTKYFYLILIASIFAFAPLQAQKIGYVDAKYVLQQMPEFQKVQEEMKAYSENAGAELKSQQEELQTKAKELEEMAQKPDAIASVIQTRYLELQEMQKQIQELQESLQEEYNGEMDKKLAPVYDQFQVAVDAVSAEKGGVYIFRLESLLYETPENDLSNVIIKKLGLTPPADNTAGSGTLSASNKIGIFDANAVINKVPEYKQAQTQLNTYQGKLRENLQKKDQTLKQKAAQLEELNKSSTASAEAKKKLRDEIVALQTQLQKEAQDAQEMTQKKYGELFDPVFKKVEDAVKAYAKENGFTYILKIESVLQEPDGSNISDEVLKKLGVALTSANE